MVPNIFPPKEFLKKLKRPPYDEILRRIPLFLSVALVLVLGISFLVTKSAPQTAGIVITSGFEDVSGLRAYQTDFRNAGTLMGSPNIQQNIIGALSAETGNSGGFGNCLADDAQLPFNVFFPGRGQNVPNTLPVKKYITVELDPPQQDKAWWMSNEGLEGLLTGAPNIPSVQKISTEMLDLVFGAGTNSGKSGIVFGNDVTPPVIIVLRYYYDSGRAVAYDWKAFNINSSSNSEYYSANGTTLAPTMVLKNADVWGHRPSTDGGCDNGKLIGSTYVLWEYHPYESQGIVAGNPDAPPHVGVPPDKVSKPYDEFGQQSGLLHDVHIVKTGNNTNNYKFITTIVNWGVFEFTPTSYNTGVLYNGLSTTWAYKMPTYCEQWSMVDLLDYSAYGYHEYDNCKGNYNIHVRPWGFHRELGGSVVTMRGEMSTTWYGQPIDNGDGVWNDQQYNGKYDSVLISVSPWKSYIGNTNDPTNHSDWYGYKLSNNFHITQPENHYYNSYTFDINNGYPESNNYSGVWIPGKIYPSELRDVSRSTNPGTVSNTYGPGDSNRPEYAGNIVVNDSNLNYINSNYFEVGSTSGYCQSTGGINPPLSPGDTLLLYDYGTNNSCWPTAGGGTFISRNGPEIFNNASAILNLKDTKFTDGTTTSQSHYSETMYKTPSGDFLVNGGGVRALAPGETPLFGYPAIVGTNGVTKWWGDPNIQGFNWYSHMGAGAYATYGTPRYISNLIGKNINNLVNNRDGGLASQVTEAPTINGVTSEAFVRDFTRVKLSGDNRNPNNPPVQANPKIAFALAGGDDRQNGNQNQSTIFNTYDTNYKDETPNPSITQTLVNQGEQHLENYHNIWLQALMWGDAGNNFGKFQTSDTPILYYWGVNYTDKTAQLTPTKFGTGGTSPDPRPTNYPDDGGSQFYTKKDQNMARYKVSATNSNGNIDWPAENIKVKDNMGMLTNTPAAKTTFYNDPNSSGSSKNPAPSGSSANQAYYRVIPKVTGGTQTLHVMAKGDKSVDATYVCVKDQSQCSQTCSTSSCYYDENLGCQSTYNCKGANGRFCASGCGAAHQCTSCTMLCPDFMQGCEGSPDCCFTYGQVPNPCWLGVNCWGYDHCNCTQRYQNACNCPTYTDHWPKMRVYVHDLVNPVGEVTVNQTSYTDYQFNYTPSGDDRVRIEFYNDSVQNPGIGTGGDCNLYIQQIKLGDDGPWMPSTTPDQSVWYDTNVGGTNYTFRYGDSLLPTCISGWTPSPICPYGEVWYGEIMPWNGSLYWPAVSILPWYPIPDTNISFEPQDNNLPQWDADAQANVGGTVTFTLPVPFTRTDGQKALYIKDGDQVDVIYTTTIVKAGLIKNKAFFTFNNRGNSVRAVSGESYCTGNAPYIATQFGDVYLGSGGVHPYYAYNNATFLIQSDGSLTNFKGKWKQEGYPLVDALKLTKGTKPVVKTMSDNVSKLKDSMTNVNTNSRITLNQLSSESVGIYCETGPLWLDSSSSSLDNNTSSSKTGNKLIVVKNGDLHITHNLSYSNSSSISDPKDLASLGVVVLNGNLIIDPAVTQMIGDYLVNGSIYTGSAYSQLTCYGLWIAKNFYLNRTYVGTDASPAEVIIYDGRVVLNAPPGFSQIGDLMPVWREVAP